MGTDLFSNKKMTDFISGKKTGKSGSKRNPVEVTVPSEKRADEIKAIAEKNDWYCEIDIDSEKNEDISALERLMNPPEPVTSDRKISPNDPCPCGSKKKYKKCCLK